MNTGKRIPATLTAILAILALTACGETPKGDGQGTVNNPDPGYVRWYELPDGNHKRTFQSLEERGYTQDVGYGRYAITEAGRRALQKDLS